MSTLTRILAVVLLALALALGFAAYRLAGTATVTPPPVARSAPDEPPRSKPEPAAELFDVVVAGRDLAPGEVLAAGDLKVVQWPQRPDQAFARIDELEGRALRLPVAEGDLLAPGWLASGLTTYLDHDQRAVTIAVDEATAQLRSIRPGDMVDVFFTLARDREQVGATQARLLLSGVRVLAFGHDSMDGPLGDVDKSSSRQQPAVPRTAVLAVPLDAVNDVLLATRSGSLQLVLRAADDPGHPDRTLFPERQPVLVYRHDLNAQQREMLRDAANQAYAGASLPDFSASSAAGHSDVDTGSADRQGPGAGRQLQLIRGSHVQSVQY